MTTAETLASVRYVTDSSGKRTEVLVPLPVWEEMLAAWQHMNELLEDQEDAAILREWLAKRAAGELEMIPLEELEQELIADGLLSR